MIYRVSNLAQSATYSCGAYGSGNFGTCETSTGSSSSGGALADTGYDILLPLALGVAIIIAGVIYFVKQVKRKQ